MNEKNLVEFHAENGEIILSVHLDLKEETVWMNLNQLAQLFQKDKSVISRHLKNIFETEELDRDSTVAIFATVQEEGGVQKTRKIDYFNLDGILSVGYRINSKRGTEFRKWATRILKEHLIKGYSFNKEQLLRGGFGEIERSLDLLKQSLLAQGHVSDIGYAAIEIIRSYAKSWTLLNAYDEDRLLYLKEARNQETYFTYEAAKRGITDLKKSLMGQKEASNLFGIERGEAFRQVLGSIHQTFGGEMLYPSIYERAAHLFYFTIKDHPFTDGNKRIGSFLLLLYLSSYGLGLKLTNEALVALALFVAQSQPQDKEIMIKLILNLITAEKE